MQKIITEHDDGRRLDKVLRLWLPDISPSLIFKFLRTGKIKLNNKKTKPDVRLKTNDTIDLYGEINIQAREPLSEVFINKKLADRHLDIIFEDDNILAINKPAGLASQSGTGVGEDIMSIIKAKHYYLEFVPQIAHRLDQETSGIIILAKTGKALRELQKLFRDKTITKEYIAIVKGVLEKPEGIIETKLEKIEGPKNKIQVSDTGKTAITKYKVLETANDLSLLKLTISTGRMHQIRVHLSSINHPILGDTKYGDFAWNREIQKKGKEKRMYLHSKRISFNLLGKDYEITNDPNWSI